MKGLMRNYIYFITENGSLKLVSVLIAAVLWVVVLGSRNVEITKDVPIEIITNPDLVVANDVPDKIAFRISGPKAFLRNILNRKEDPIKVNLSNLSQGLVTHRFFLENLQVPLGVKVTSVSPSAIVVKLESIKKKDVLLKLVTTGSISLGRQASNISLTKSVIKIKGAESKIDSITELGTTPIDLGKLQGSGEQDVKPDLSKHPGISIEGDHPKLHYEVDTPFATYKIRKVAIRVNTKRKYKVEPQELTLYVQCSSEELEKLDQSKVFGEVDASTKGPGKIELPISVQLPGALKLIRVLPNKVKITLF